MSRTPVPGIERSRPVQTPPIRMPAEWEPQDALLLIWPHVLNGWEQNLDAVESVFLELVSATSTRQKVLLVCQDKTHGKHITKLLDSNNIEQHKFQLFVVPSNNCWARDTGPISIMNDEQAKLLNFRFNGWGLKYAYEIDDQLNSELNRQRVFSCPMQSIPVILEGGSIDGDGRGTLLTTRSCLLSEGRNKSYDETRLEQLLKQLLGVHTIHWLSHGMIAGDDTDGHIDTLARFCPNNTIVYSSCDDASDANHESLRLMENELLAFQSTDGSDYSLLSLPLPSAIYNSDGNQLPATYVNYQIINNAVLCSQYNDPADSYAIEQLQYVFPDREIIGINALPIIEQLGSLHCLCMQLAKGTID